MYRTEAVQFVIPNSYNAEVCSGVNKCMSRRYRLLETKFDFEAHSLDGKVVLLFIIQTQGSRDLCLCQIYFCL